MYFMDEKFHKNNQTGKKQKRNEHHPDSVLYIGYKTNNKQKKRKKCVDLNLMLILLIEFVRYVQNRYRHSI